MKNMVTTEEALKELISRVPDEVLSEAIGGMSARSRDRLIKLGLVAAVAAVGYGGYRWYNSRNAGEGKSPVIPSTAVDSSESDIESGLPKGCRVTPGNLRKQEYLRDHGNPDARVYTDADGREHIIYSDPV